MGAIFRAKTIGAALLGLLVLMAFAVAAEQQGSARPAIKLGAIASLTGNAARNGQNWLEGMQLAVDHLNRAGQQVQLVVEDDGTVPGRVATAFVKLAALDKVDGIVGGTWDFLAETAYPLAKQYRVPFITPTNPIEILSAAARKNPWVFTNAHTLSAEKEVIIRFLQNRNVKTLGLIYINVPYGTSHADLLREIAGEQRLTIVSDSQITYEGFRESIKLAALRAAQRKPDLVFVVLNYEGVDLLLREFLQLEAAPLVLMTHTLQEAFDFGGSSVRYRRAYGVFPEFASAEFTTAFEKKYGRLPYGYAAAGYDAGMFIAKIAESKRSEPLPQLTVIYEGITGKHQLPAADPCVVQAGAMIMGVREGRLVRIDEPMSN